jgi:hypothetical protein
MSNRTYVCLDCRTAKRAEAAYGLVADYRCSSCGKPLSELGWRRRIPRKTDGKGWKELQAYLHEIDNSWGPYRTRIGMYKLNKINRIISSTQAQRSAKDKEKKIKKLKFKRQTTAKKHNLE